MPSDNARIVREALDCYRDHLREIGGVTEIPDGAEAALTALETELSDLKAELARVREEERKAADLLREALPTLNAHECGFDCGVFESVSCPVPDVRMRIKYYLNRAALAPRTED